MKKSGYDVTFAAFLQADANDMESMVTAAAIIRRAVIDLHEAGFREIEARPKYRQRREVAEPDTQAKGGNPEAPGGASDPAAGDASRTPPPDPDAPLPMLPELRRTRA